MSSYQIIPTLIADNPAELQNKIKQIEPYFPETSIDFFDGDFVKTKTLLDLNALDSIKTKLVFNCHLMSKDPEKQIKKIKKNKLIKKIYFHIEINKNINNIIELIKKYKKTPALAIKQSTGLNKLKPFLNKINSVLVLNVKPGFYGGKYMPSSPEKIKNLKNLKPNLEIASDGGINDQNIKNLAIAGAKQFHVGSFLFSGKILNQKQKLKKSLYPY